MGSFSDLPPHEQRWRAVRKARFRVAADLQSDLVEADEIEPGTVVVQISRLVEIEHKNPSGHVLHVRRCKVRVEETGILDSIFADHPEGWVTIDSRASPADGGTFFVPLGEGDEVLKMLPEELADRQSAPELKGSIGEGPNHSNHSNHSNSFKIGFFPN